MKKIFISITLSFLLPVIIFSQDIPSSLSKIEHNEMMNALKEDTLLAQFVTRFGDPEELFKNFKTSIQKADSLYKYDQEHIRPFSNLGCTEHFKMLPLIDWFTSNDSLIGEAGVAYLIKTDDATILFDVGLNQYDSDPSPLLRNMKKLGIHLEDIDVIVISHDHSDHIGGGKWYGKNTFSLTSHQINLGEKQILTPIQMTYPGLQPTFTPTPTKIAKGVATIGVIPCPLFFANTQEQAIAINVKNKGIVIVSGCGHQTIEKIIQRTERLFIEPIYAFLGGYHLPLTEGRNIDKYYQYFLTNRLPWKPLRASDVTNMIDLLKKKGIKFVGISGHDSCDLSITMFRDAFTDYYIDIVVGDKIIFK